MKVNEFELLKAKLHPTYWITSFVLHLLYCITSLFFKKKLQEKAAKEEGR